MADATGTPVTTETFTMASLQAAYDDNADYAETASATKAAAFITACRRLIRRTPTSAGHGGGAAESVSFDVRLLQDEIQAAQKWIAANGTGPGGQSARFASFENFRT